MFLFLDFYGEISSPLHRSRYTLLDVDSKIITICELQAEKLPYLKSLTLTGHTNVFDSDNLAYFCRTMFHGRHCYQELQNLGDMMAVWNLEYLNLSFNRNITGHLSVLLRHRFPSLETLVLHDCELNSDDMRCLGSEQVKNLPKLKELNVSWNRIGVGDLSVLLSHRFPSLETLHMSTCGLNSDGLRCLTEAREQGKLPNLKRLDVSENWSLDDEKWNEIWKDVVIKWDDQ